MRRLAPSATDSSTVRHERTKPAKEQLPHTVIRLALVNRARNDVCSSTLAHDSSHSRDFAFRWQRTEISNTLEINPFARRAIAYAPEAWIGEILAALSRSIHHGANVVCFGEFDYPPFPDTDEGRADERAFEAEVLKRINGTDAPVFAILGSHHRVSKLSGRGSDWTGPLAQNVAKIALSDPLKGTGKAFREVLKRTPASKAGELLTGIHGIDMEVFDTIIGKFGVVVCSDAYDPSIVLEYFAHSGHAEYKRDVILVPSYNKSAKLPHMCQALSLMARSVVIMVDVCREHSQALGPFEKSSVWVCGIPVAPGTDAVLYGDKHKVCRWIAEEEVDGVTIKVLELTLPALDNFIDHMDTVDPLPLFASVLEAKWG